MSRRPVKHSVTLRGHRTSISLEDEFWKELRTLADKKGMAINALVAEIDVNRGTGIGLASALRLYVLEALKDRLSASQTDAR
ncbi:ribbon-helix-helix domain-containing protein [Roseobacter sp.]|uniref:ribbon-helix-helix domain-containing protein n=1 Tax=Roseobacter sp. TaxID=1907202 RepID=UPI0025E894DE|nr:ribbon-helix-helix domain-containing protein [Roseobacter sp.]